MIKTTTAPPGSMLGTELMLLLLADMKYVGLEGMHLRSIPLACFRTIKLNVIQGTLRE